MTTEWYRYRHCAFLLELEDRDFVFDPTGPRFGPSWPVVSALEDYCQRMSCLDSCSPLGTLKRQREQQMKQRRKLFTGE